MLVPLAGPASRIALPVAIVACYTPPPRPPGPRELDVRAAQAIILDSAAALLQRSGWAVVALDAAGGTLRADREAVGDANGEWMVCENGVGRTGDTRRGTRDLRSTVSVVVDATVTADHSRVRIRADVPLAYSIFGISDRGVPEYVVSQCVSSGAIEARLAEALAAAFPEYRVYP